MKNPIIHQYPDGSTAELTDDNIHAFDAATQASYLALRAIEGKPILTNKYFQSLKTHIKHDWLKEIVGAQPDISMNVAVAKVLERLPHFIPGDKLVELTKFVIGEWEKRGVGRATAELF